jgi:MFS family permease
MILTSIMVLLSEVAPFKYRGGAIGMYRTFMDIGGFIGPMFFMEIFGRIGSNFAFISAIGVIAASTPFMLTIKPPESKKEED